MEPQPPRESPPKPTVWVDTMVMFEVLAQKDLHRMAEREGLQGIEKGRRPLRDSLWLAVAFDDQAVASMSLSVEVHALLQRLVPPGSPESGWTALMMQMLPELFPRWIRYRCNEGADLPEGKAGNNDRDRLIVELCKRYGIKVLITRDRSRKRGEPNMFERAAREGMTALEPHEYATNFLTCDEAHDRLSTRMMHFASRQTEGKKGDEFYRTVFPMLAMLNRYGGISQPDGYMEQAPNGGLLRGLLAPGVVNVRKPDE